MIDDMYNLFFNNFSDCPWYDEDGNCKGSKDVSYNGHLNDMQVTYEECEYSTCPIFHWVEVLNERMK